MGIKSFKKVRFGVFVIIFIVAAVFSLLMLSPRGVARAATDYTWYGDGSAVIFNIDTADKLAGLAEIVNGTAAPAIPRDDFAGKTINLTDNIDLTAYKAGAGWTPISRDAARPFRGTFDGAGFEISNLTANRFVTVNRTDRVGLFGYLYDATVKNVTLIDVDIEGYDYVGGITGDMYRGGGGVSTITNCRVYGEIKGRQRVGGIVGFMQNGTTVYDCSFSGNISSAGGSSAAADYMGGIAGYFFGSSISKCYSEGTISGRDRVGGIAGYSSSFSASANTVLQDCYSTADVSGRDCVGGIAGSINLSQTNSPLANTTFLLQRAYSTGNITGNASVGGIAGWLKGAMQSCAALNGRITAGTAAERAIGMLNAGTLSGNIAFSGMAAAGGTLFHEEMNAADKLGGADIDASQIKGDGTLGGLFAAAPWVCENGKLPAFDTPADEPPHLIPKAVNALMFELVAETFVYNGTEHKPQVVLTAAGAAAVPKITYTAAYGNNINAGSDTAEAVITGTGNYCGEVTLTFTIDKAPPPAYGLPVIAPRTYQYGQTLGANVNLPLNWAWDEPATLLGVAGTEYFWATYTPADGNYHSVSAQVEVVINKNTVTNPPNPATNPAVYNGGANVIGVANFFSPGNAVMSDGVSHPIFSLIEGQYQATDTGHYNAVYRLFDPSVWMWRDGTTADRRVDWTLVDPAPMGDGAATVEKADVVYNGTPGETAEVKITTGDWEIETLQYRVSGTGDAFWSYAAPVNVGTYEIRAVLSGSPSHTYADYKTQAVTYEIMRRPITADMFDAVAPFVYNGAAHTPGVNTSMLAAGRDYTLTGYSNNMGAGNASVNLQGEGNYSGTLSIVFVIIPKAITITPLAGQSKVFGETDAAIAYTAAGMAAGDVLTGALIRETGENAGEYKILLGTLGSPDYQITFTEDIVFTIEKGFQDAPKLILTSHSDTALTVKAEDGAEYSLDGITWQNSNAFGNLTADTDYTVYMRVKGTDNLNESEIISAHFFTDAVGGNGGGGGNGRGTGGGPSRLWLWFLIGLAGGSAIMLLIWFLWLKRKKDDDDGDGVKQKKLKKQTEGGK